MLKLDKVVDCSTWTGNWPFAGLRYSDIAKLEAKLKSENVQRAYVSQFESVFQQDPLTVDKALFEATSRSGLFSPAPLIDLSFPNWAEAAKLYAATPAVKMVKLIPNYHMYELNEEMLAPLVEITSKAKLVIAIQIRLEDERSQHPLMKVAPVDVFQLLKVLSFFPEQSFILNNPYQWEILELGDVLENVYVDMTMVEPVEPLKALRGKPGLDRMLFSSNCPLFYPEGNLNKLKCADIPKEDLDKVTFGTIERLVAGRG